MRRSPCDDQAVRNAVSRLVNRDYVKKMLPEGSVTAADTFVPPLSESCTDKAAAALRV
jgi:ABC-type oligopeptide transport system substrate-binding subunit